MKYFICFLVMLLGVMIYIMNIITMPAQNVYYYIILAFATLIWGFGWIALTTIFIKSH